jgi:hypothetical protein
MPSTLNVKAEPFIPQTVAKCHKVRLNIINELNALQTIANNMAFLESRCILHTWFNTTEEEWEKLDNELVCNFNKPRATYASIVKNC